METIDIVVAGVCGLFFILGLFKGIIKIIFTVSGFVASLFLGYFLYPSISVVLSQSIEFFTNNPVISSVASFFIIFVFVNLSFFLASLLLTSILRALNLKWLDKFIGGACSLLIALIVWSLILNALAIVPIDPDKRVSLENSLSYKFVRPIFFIVKDINIKKNIPYEPNEIIENDSLEHNNQKKQNDDNGEIDENHNEYIENRIKNSFEFIKTTGVLK